MKVAIPTIDGILCPHFGHCQKFAVLDVDPDKKSINRSEMLTPPPHEPGVLPAWLSRMGCNVIIAGGMGGRAIDLFEKSGVTVVMGATGEKPEEIVLSYLNGELTGGVNRCDDPAFHGDKPCDD